MPQVSFSLVVWVLRSLWRYQLRCSKARQGWFVNVGKLLGPFQRMIRRWGLKHVDRTDRTSQKYIAQAPWKLLSRPRGMLVYAVIMLVAGHCWVCSPLDTGIFHVLRPTSTSPFQLADDSWYFVYILSFSSWNHPKKKDRTEYGTPSPWKLSEIMMDYVWINGLVYGKI